MNQPVLLKALIAVMALGLMVGCKTTPSKPGEAGDASAEVANNGSSSSSGVAVSDDPRAPLERRVTDRWKLLTSGDAARAYQYLTPGYRATKSEKEYIEWVRARQVVWSGAKYQDHTCSDPDSCTVGLQLAVKVKLRGVAGEQETTAYISEHWLKIDGIWYHFPKAAL